MFIKDIGYLKIKYNADKVLEINKIINIISKNKILFDDFKGSTISFCIEDENKDDFIYTDDFYKLFRDRLNVLINDKSFKESLNRENISSALYVQLLVLLEKDNGMTLVPVEPGVTEDIVWFLIGCLYYEYNNDFDKLYYFLIKRDNKEEIFEWLKETQRFDTYNFLLEIARNFLKQYDFSFYDNFSNIVNKFTESTLNYAMSVKDEGNIVLESLSMLKFEQVFFGFLKRINAPVEWYSYYKYLKDNNWITFEKNIDGVNDSCCYKDVDGNRKIKVTTDGTIRFFVSFVHEFIHYVSSIKGTSQFSLEEFPSIYYEKIAARYLIEIGYNENIIRKVLNDRNQNNFDIYCAISSLLLDINKFDKQGYVCKEEKVKLFSDSLDVIYKTRVDIYELTKDSDNPIDDPDFLKYPDYDIEGMVDKECDQHILSFIREGLLVLNGYQYLIDSYLSLYLFENKDEEEILEKMKFITDNLRDYNIDKLLDYFDIKEALVNRSDSIRLFK